MIAAVLLLALTAHAQPIETEEELACSGTVCFGDRAGCDDYRARLNDEGRSAPACRAVRSIHCVVARDSITGEDGVWCSTTRAGCAAQRASLQRVNRRSVRHVYEDISECGEMRHVDPPAVVVWCFSYRYASDDPAISREWCSMPEASAESACAATRARYEGNGILPLSACAEASRRPPPPGSVPPIDLP